MPASLRRRILAVVIDAGVSILIVAVVASVAVALAVAIEAISLAAAVPVGAAAGLVWFLVQTAMQAGDGSIGMRLMGVRLAHTGDDQNLGFGRSLARNLLFALTGTALVGLFSPLFDPSPWRRGWHDFATGAVVIDAASVRQTPPRAVAMPDRPIEVASRADAAPAAPPVVIPFGRAATVAAAPNAAPTAVAAAAAAPAVVAPTPASGPAASDFLRPAPWAPAPMVARRVPRTLPVEVISTVPGVHTRNDVRPHDGRSAPATLATLRWDDGTRHTVYDATLFGRSPAAEPGMHLIPVRDETLSISKTHFEIGADAQGAWVCDRHSLNGVVIIRAGVPQRIIAGERARVWPGDVLDVGDRRVTVESAR
ncbi:RDD family protein [Microbacterium sp.]|uniref:RDD family protein n=1 Tax=Microbacterium sp. TaxID=51671 RepID=UPI00373578A0